MRGSEGEKKLFIFDYLSINETIFTSLSGDGTTILHGHQNHAKVWLFAGIREYHHFSVIFKPWVLVWLRESNQRPPALQSSALPTELILLWGGWGNASWRFCHCKFNTTRGEVRKLVCHVANDSILVYSSDAFCRGKCKGLFTWRWGNPPVHIISHFNLITFTW